MDGWREMSRERKRGIDTQAHTVALFLSLSVCLCVCVCVSPPLPSFGPGPADRIWAQVQQMRAYAHTHEMDVEAGGRHHDPTIGTQSNSNDNDSGNGAKRAKRASRPQQGSFASERHTRGVGSSIMKKQGWREGEAIGRRAGGLLDALEGEGTRWRFGIGYRGPPKMPWERHQHQQQQQQQKVKVATANRAKGG